MRRTTINKWWLTNNAAVLGFEGEGEGAEGANGAAGGAAGSGAEGEGKPEGANSQPDETAGLKSALQKEREGRKQMEKELAAFRKQQQEAEDAKKDDVQRLTDQQARAAERLAKLAVGYKNSAVEQAILQAAGEAKFRDPSDALRPEILSAIGVEQDEDDPSKVTIDATTVKDAIKALAKSKPHYLVVPGNGGPSGSKFGGNTQQGKTDRASELAAKYPALRTRMTKTN